MLKRRSWSLQGAASAFAPDLAPSGLGMSPPTVMAAASQAAMQDVTALRRLSLQHGQCGSEEVYSFSKLADTAASYSDPQPCICR